MAVGRQMDRWKWFDRRSPAVQAGRWWVTAARQEAGYMSTAKRAIYPFAPTGQHCRDTAFELQVRAQLRSDLPVENDLTRWFPLWSAPGL